MGAACHHAVAALVAVIVFVVGDAVVTAAADVPGVTRRVLANGMTVIVRESRAASVVAASLQVDAGSIVENGDTAGITNLVQRVMIRGTVRRSASQLAEATEEIGGVIDASADADHAEISGRALARHWEGLLGLVAEVALSPAFSAGEVKQARRLVRSQIVTRADTPLAFATDALMHDLYGGHHPYALPSAGRRESVSSLTRDALVAHYRRIYQPARLVLAVSGDVQQAQVLKRVERLFGKLPASPVTDRPSLPAPTPTRERRIVDRPAQQAQILIGFLGPALDESDYPAVKVLAAVLGGGTAGRFFAELRERRGLAYSLGVLNPSRRGPSAFVNYLSTTLPNVDTAETAMRAEIERVRTEPPTAAEVERARAYVLGTLAMDRRTNGRQVWYLAFFELVGVGWDFPDRYVKAVEAITPSRVFAAARRYLDRPTTIVLRPPAP